MRSPRCLAVQCCPRPVGTSVSDSCGTPQMDRSPRKRTYTKSDTGLTLQCVKSFVITRLFQIQDYNVRINCRRVHATVTVSTFGPLDKT